jgi:putative ABC transport system ATP-binding protein
MQNKENVIELENISKVYKTGDENTVALDSIDLKIEKGDFVAIIGPSGSGKSTLMHILGLLDVPTSGKYLLDEKDVSKLNNNKQAEIRNQKIGFVFQQFNLLPRTTVLDNVLLPTIYGNQKNIREKAQKIIEDVGLSDRASHKSNELSGGQIQRVAIARALIMGPSIILADEPTGNLDTKKSKEIMNILEKINHDGATVILITHEQDIAKYARRVIKLSDGKIVEDKNNTK